MSNLFEKEYKLRVNAWGRRVAASRGLQFNENVSFRIEGEPGYGGGCDTCGHGADNGGFRLYANSDLRPIAEYEFNDLAVVMRGIWGD